MMNKKAALGAQTMVFVFILIILLILGGLVLGISMFFGSEYDFREVDASLLNYRLQKCFAENEFNFALPEKEFEKEFYSSCQLDQNATTQNFFIYITYDDKTIYETGPGDITQCALADKNPNYPKCVNSTLTKNQKTIFIQTGSNQKAVKRKT